MIKKITFYILCGMILLFSFSCYENDQEAAITVDFGSVDALQEATGISEISKASIIPYTVSTIEIKVYSGDEVKGVVYRKIFYRRDFAADRVTINVPAGTGRIVKVTARHMDGTVLYTGASDPVNLASGVDVTVPVTMANALTNPLTGPPDAYFNVQLMEYSNISSGTTTNFTNRAWFRTTNPIVVRIYAPTVNLNNYLELGASIEDATHVKYNTELYAFPATTPRTISDLRAYPHRYQMVVAMAMASDGTIAAIGGTVISSLNSNLATHPATNQTYTITMVPPAPIMITHTVDINAVSVQMDFGTGYVTVSLPGNTIIPGSKYAYLYLPNRVNNVKEFETSDVPDYETYARNVQISVNGSPYSLRSLIATDGYLRWKQTIIDFPTWTWSLPPEY